VVNIFQPPHKYLSNEKGQQLSIISKENLSTRIIHSIN